MLEIRFHGRGGQGTVVASILLANAFFKAGYYVQSFPLFGVERRGAPVEAFLRVDGKPIWLRTNVYKPDHVMVQDPSLLDFVDVTKGLRPGGMVLINQPQPKTIPDRFSGFRVIYLNANRIALNNGLGTRTHPIINTAMVGGFARLLKELSLENIVASISEEVPSNHEANIKAARQAYDTVLESSNNSGELPVPSPGFPQGKQPGVCSRLRLQCPA